MFLSVSIWLSVVEAYRFKRSNTYVVMSYHSLRKTRLLLLSKISSEFMGRLMSKESTVERIESFLWTGVTFSHFHSEVRRELLNNLQLLGAISRAHSC